MEIRNYQLGDEAKILDLFKIVFNQELSIDNWLWRFRDNPAGKHLIKLMWEGNLLIGHYAVSPVIMSVNDKDVYTAHSLTTMTHPDFNGRGVFKQLSAVMFDELENKFDCKAIWGFPNNNSHYGFVKHLDWTNLNILHTLGLSTRKLKTKIFEYKVKSITKFDLDHVAFIKKKNSKFASVFVKKNLSYLNWRFINKPNSNYKSYHFQTESNQAILVVKPYSLNNSLYDLNILECYMDDYQEIQTYINYIIRDLNLQFDKVSLWKSIFDPDHLSLEKQGFIPVLPQTYLAARIHSNMPNSFSDFRNWRISMSDSDVF